MLELPTLGGPVPIAACRACSCRFVFPAALGEGRVGGCFEPQGPENQVYEIPWMALKWRTFGYYAGFRVYRKSCHEAFRSKASDRSCSQARSCVRALKLGCIQTLRARASLHLLGTTELHASLVN